MKTTGDEHYAALRLVVSGDDRLPEVGGLDLEQLLRLARSNRVLLRVTAALEKAGIKPPDAFADEVIKEQERVRAQIELIARLGRACEEKGIDFIFAKAFQHYPDAGSDVDMFVSSRSRNVDALVLERFAAVAEKRGFYHRVAGTANYKIGGCDSTLEIHHGRIGYFGETDSYVPALIKNGRKVEVAGREFLSPSHEDNIVLQGMLKTCGRLYVRLCDVACAISSVSQASLDWDYVISTSKKFGSFHGLCSYLSYVDQIHAEVFGSRLLSSDLKGRLALDGWGRMEFKGGFYRFPAVQVVARIYLDKFKAALLSGNLAGATRLTLLPAVAATAALRKLKRMVLN